MANPPLDFSVILRIDPVLVVEDNRLNRLVVMLLLERLGVPAEAVKNGIEAIEAVRHRHYSAILMDCHMPEMDGFEATKVIRKIETTSLLVACIYSNGGTEV